MEGDDGNIPNEGIRNHLDMSKYRPSKDSLILNYILVLTFERSAPLQRTGGNGSRVWA
jgi:hypothetical protein